MRNAHCRRGAQLTTIAGRRQLNGGPAKIYSSHAAQRVQFEAFDPTQL
jgi:hypothetical protein